MWGRMLPPDRAALHWIARTGTSGAEPCLKRPAAPAPAPAHFSGRGRFKKIPKRNPSEPSREILIPECVRNVVDKDTRLRWQVAAIGVVDGDRSAVG